MPVAKEDKIRNLLVPEYASSKWFWAAKGKIVKYSQFHGRSYDVTESLEKEFTDFPLAEHDDLLDCQTFLSQMTLVKPHKIVQNMNKGLTLKEYIEGGEERNQWAKDNPWENCKALQRV